jgi:hypothetical protein
MPMSLQIALQAETHVAEGLTLKLWLTITAESSTYLYTDRIKYGRTAFFAVKYIYKKKGHQDAATWNQVWKDSV